MRPFVLTNFHLSIVSLLFSQELANDPRKANELLADAEQIEDEHSRALANQVERDVLFASKAEFDFQAESLALLKVSSRPDDMGIITGMNLAALKVYGYNRREVMGRDIATLLPEPISSIHG